MRIAYLDGLEAGERTPYSRWFDLGRDAGITVDFITHVPGREGELPTETNRLLSEADAFIVPNDWLFHGSFYAKQLRQRVQDGARAILFLHPTTVDAMERINSFGAHFDIAASPIKLFSTSHNTEHPRLIWLDRGATITADGGDFWQRVPWQVREKCDGRQKSEGAKRPMAAYLDLFDLKKIIDANPALFLPTLRSSGLVDGSVDWIGRLNKIRQLVMHPTKGHISGIRISEGEMRFLAECDLAARRLYRSRHTTAT